MIRTVVVSDLGLLRESLSAVLETEPGLEVAGATHTDELGDVCRMAPDVAVVDVDDPDRRGLAAVQKLAGDPSAPAVVALTARRTPAMLRQVLAAEARGFASKDQPPQELAELIRRVAAGDRMVHPPTALAALAAMENPLTEREREVLRLAALGLPSKEIASRLYLAGGTVRNYLSGILRKLGCSYRLQAVRLARESGWL